MHRRALSRVEILSQHQGLAFCTEGSTTRQPQAGRTHPAHEREDDEAVARGEGGERGRSVERGIATRVTSLHVKFKATHLRR